MRLFIAVLPEPDMLRALTDAQNALRRNEFSGKYTEMRNLHLTLTFIGEYSDADAVLEQMEQIRFRPVKLKLSGYIGNFGDLLWAGVEDAPELERIVRQLRHTLAEAQIPFDKKRFHPHFTLLRNAQSRRRFAEIPVRRESMTLRGISLMRSDFGKHGAAYTEIGRVGAMP
ncbi:MAG: RNA 2',3'-cyclic phosphodiesterase [Oscillospiraceae bacterium]|nr:RNA 2',3'-cyclic phosphodiesterase [Oscillospiraceae bacterium]